MNDVEKDMLKHTAKCLFQSFQKIINDFINECLYELGLENGDNKEEFIEKKKIKIICYRRKMRNIIKVICKKENYKKQLTVDFSQMQII